MKYRTPCLRGSPPAVAVPSVGRGDLGVHRRGETPANGYGAAGALPAPPRPPKRGASASSAASAAAGLADFYSNDATDVSLSVQSTFTLLSALNLSAIRRTNRDSWLSIGSLMV